MILRRTRGLTPEEIEARYSTPQFLRRLRDFWKREVVERFPREKIEALILALAEKFLRRIRIWILKMDYFLTQGLNRLQEARKAASAPAASYWEQVKAENGASFPAGIPESKVEPSEKLHPVVLEQNLAKKPHATLADFKNLARLYLAEKNFSDGRRVLLRCWRRWPKDPDVISLLDDIRENEGKVEADKRGLEIS